MKKKNDDKLVKIDAGLYERIGKIIEKNHIEYPSIKNLVERAVFSFIGTMTKTGDEMKIAKKEEKKEEKTSSENIELEHRRHYIN
jgi:hypothetical protein